MNEEYKYDEDAAIKFIRTFISEESNQKFTDDDILFVIDCIWDFYDDKGFLELSDTDEDDEFDIDEMVEYVAKAIKKDGEIKATNEEIKLIIKGEIDYEESIDGFNN